jgi:hypothetical protein
VTKIRGCVDENNSPLPGANIYLKETYDGISSSGDGTFTFTTDETGDAILIVSFIGYKQVEKKLTLDGKNIDLEIILEVDSKELGTL